MLTIYRVLEIMLVNQNIERDIEWDQNPIAILFMFFFFLVGRYIRKYY